MKESCHFFSFGDHMCLICLIPPLLHTIAIQVSKAASPIFQFFVDQTSGYELARRCPQVYFKIPSTACETSDGFFPHGVSDRIEAEMRTKARK